MGSLYTTSMSKEKRPAVKQETPSSLIKDIESDIDELIRYLLKRLLWYMKKLESLQDDISESNRTSNAISQLVSSLHSIA